MPFKRIMQPDGNRPYFTKHSRGGCDQCGFGATWDVIERATNTEMGSFQNSVDADEFAEILTSVWEHGRQQAVIDFAFTDDDRSRYNELIMAVGNKHHGESRYETALRYIRQAEERESSAAKKGTSE